MCGIAGIITNKRSKMTVLNLLRNSIETMRNRGPDSNGKELIEHDSYIIGLAHTRLSIIDLSLNGEQPFKSSCGDYSLIFNGEIYNYLELKEELSQKGYLFRTTTDTEVLMNLWIEHGINSIEKIEGMYAFCICDKKNRKVYLTRDANGMKPLYIKNMEGELIFSSDIRFLLNSEFGKNTIQEDILNNYILFGRYDNTNNTFFRGIKCQKPGEIKIFEMDNPNIYSSIYPLSNINDIENKNMLDHIIVEKKVKNLFLESITKHLRSDAPMAVPLSGGVDSSSILYCVNKVYPDKKVPVFTFCAEDPKLNEERWVNEIISETENPWVKVRINKNEFVNDFEDLIKSQGQPFGSPGIYVFYRLYQEMSKCGIKVSLDGQGADELFGGYFGYPYAASKEFINKRKLINLCKYSYNWSNLPGRELKQSIKNSIRALIDLSVPKSVNKRIFFNQVSAKLEWTNPDDVKEYINREIERSNNYTRLNTKSIYKKTLAEALFMDGLPNLLRTGDHSSMRWGIESRLPFLYPRLIEFILGLPFEAIISLDGQTKSLLRKSMSDIVPHKIINRKDKLGAQPPTELWLEHLINENEKIINKYKRDIKILNTELREEPIKRLYKDKIVSTDIIWRICNYCLWKKEFNV